MSLSKFITGRLTLRESGNAGKRIPAVNVAIGGIALSVAVMLLAIAIVTGFKSRIEEKIMGFDAQLTVTPVSRLYAGGENEPLTLDSGLRESLEALQKEYPGMTSTESIEEGGILKTDDDFMGLMFRSMRGDATQQFLTSNITEGSLPEDEEDGKALVISHSTATKLKLNVGDKVNAYFISGEAVKPRKFTVTAIYDSHFGEYDNTVCYIPYPTLAQLNRYSDSQTSCIKISGLPNDKINDAAMSLQQKLSEAYARGTTATAANVTTVLMSGAMYFNWLDLLDTNVVVLLILMGCVSGFMLISCVMILILQRVQMIGTLKALGATDRQISAIFMRLGMRVTLTGVLTGNLVSGAIILTQMKWHILPLDPEAYFLTYVPMEPQLWSWLLLNAGVIALSMGLMLMPTALVSRLSPLKSMRFE